jgi:polysaccharide pyruvyl transferase CsaB
MLDVLFTGYFGFGNLGDELILSATVEELYRESPECAVGVLVGPEGSRLPAASVQIPRSDKAAVRQALASCRVLALGPGGILQDATSARSVAWYASIVHRARLSGARIVHVGQSIGPLRGIAGRAFSRWALRRSEAVLVRDESSLHLARRLGCGSRTELVADAGWLLPKPRLVRERAHRVAVAPRRWRRGRLTPEWWRALLTQLHAEDWEVVGLAMCEDDLRLLTEVARLTGRKAELVRPSSPEEALAALAPCEAVIGMRLHALLLGALSGCRLLGLSYDPKVSGLLRALGLEPAGSTHEPPPVAALAELLGTPTWGVPEAGRIEAERRKARRNVEVLVEVIASSQEGSAPVA